MSPTLEAVLRSWPVVPGLLAGVVVATAVYVRGWVVLRERDRHRWHGGQLAAWLGAMATTYLAVASPLEPLSALLLQAHMVQHLLLMMVAPLLVWLSEPLLPMLRGLPAGLRRECVTPFLTSPVLRRWFTRLTHPVVALPISVAAIWIWHVPVAYEAALRSTGWHYLQHGCFFASGLLFWSPVVRPFPARPTWSPWLLCPYLLLADVQNTVLSALFTFSASAFYPWYEQVPRLWGITPIVDQRVAGVIMWVPGSLLFLVPLFAIAIRLLSGRGAMRGRGPWTWASGSGRTRNPVASRSGLVMVEPQWASTSPPPARASRRFDLLRVPLLGTVMRWQYARQTVQCVSMVVAVAVVVDGFRGPRVAAMNLAGVVPWIHWRGGVVLGLLLVGNVACMGCPFTLPRRLARGWLPVPIETPVWLRTKWVGVALLAIFLWSYDAFALWSSPWLTAWIVVGYFVTAFVAEAWFGAGTFCRSLCPIGQFNFVNALVSPFEVKVHDNRTCADCRTQDCIRGNDRVPGCEMQLTPPRKSGNLDCTFCLDCVHACPHENLGVVAVVPAARTWQEGAARGLGRFGERWDIAMLAILLFFGALANAAGMVGPVLAQRDRVAAEFGGSEFGVVTVYYAVGLILVPAGLICGCTAISRWFVHATDLETIAKRFCLALVPLGFALWLAHYGFHLATSYAGVIPTTQRFVADTGLLDLGLPRWACACCESPGDWLLRLELLVLDVGLLGSLYATYRIGSRLVQTKGSLLGATLPWAALLVAYYALSVWTLFQPMEMRGTLGGGG